MSTPVSQALEACCRRFPDADSVVVAYSGGRDSHVLLHAAKQFVDRPLRALHVAHGLQEAARSWPQHCQNVCSELDITLCVVDVQVQDSKAGPEAAARAARYDVFAEHLQRGELLLMAHHAEDQAETLLLRLMRGTGLRGLSAMPADRSLGKGRLLRPLLSLSSQALAQYAEQHQLHWVEDPSNRDERFDRNYVRQRVMPALVERWPSATRQLSVAARHAAEANQMLQDLLKPILEELLAPDGGLNCSGLLAKPELHQRHLLRAWLANHSHLPPTEAQLTAILGDVVAARGDADPVFLLHRFEIRRHQQRLFWVDPNLQALPSVTDWHDWSQPLQLAELELSMQSPFGQRLQIPESAVLQVRFRQGGERLALRRGERSLKKLLQETGVPSWRRDRTPLLFIGQELVAVWDVSIAEKYDKSLK